MELIAVNVKFPIDCIICTNKFSVDEENKNKQLRCDVCSEKNLCIHGILKTDCIKKCARSGYCYHNKQKNLCKNGCGGSGICDHGRRRDRCKECKGVGICEHGRLKASCKDCMGSSYCEHKKRKQHCKICMGSSRCEHGKFKHICYDCGGKDICIHKKQKAECRECGGNAFCEHIGDKGLTKRKVNCHICSPHLMCKHCKYSIPSKFGDYCAACYWHLNPHETKTKLNGKELSWRQELVKFFDNEEKNDVEIIFDKKIEGGCSRRRPDAFIDRLTHSIVLECDEYGHRGYDEICENKRIMEIFEDLGSRPIVFLRFNPDKDNYKNRLDLFLHCCRLMLYEPPDKDITIQYF